MLYVVEKASSKQIKNYSTASPSKKEFQAKSSSNNTLTHMILRWKRYLVLCVLLVFTLHQNEDEVRVRETAQTTLLHPRAQNERRGGTWYVVLFLVQGNRGLIFLQGALRSSSQQEGIAEATAPLLAADVLWPMPESLDEQGEVDSILSLSRSFSVSIC